MIRTRQSRPAQSGRVLKHQRNGLSLLEVVLALAILAVSAALLSQIARQASDNGRIAHRLATAQILCESKMSEVLAGAISLQSNSWTEITDPVPNGTWYYRVETLPAQRKDMVGVRLSVSDNPETTVGNPEVFFIVRWMIDPNLGLDTLPQNTGTTGTSGTTTGAGATAGGIQ